MCGIVGVACPKDNVFSDIISGLESLEYRGYDSWGIAGVAKSKTRFIVRKAIGSICLRSRISIPHISLGIGHTRWATHGRVTLENAHPQFDSARRYAVVHNGIIENWKALKASLPSQLKWTSETDTEIIPQILSTLDPDSPLLQKLAIIGKQITGSNAFVVVDRLTGQLGAACYGSPLIIGSGLHSGYVVSDIVAFPNQVTLYYPLKTNQTAVWSGDHWQKTSTPIIFRSLTKPMTHKKTHKNKPGHFMLAELKESPQIFKQSFVDDIKIAKHVVQHAQKIWLTGAGTAHHAALFGAHWFRQHRVMAQSFPASESATYLPIINQHDCVILISQSGETRDTLTVAKHISELHIPSLGIINRQHSTLSSFVTHELLTPAGIEQAVLATKSLTAQLAYLYQLAGNEPLTTQTIENTADLLKQTISSLEQSAIVDQIVPLLASSPFTLVIGKCSGWILTQETALKLKEGAYLPAEGMTSGEIKHGTLALIQPGSISIVFDIEDSDHLTLMSHVEEIASRGGLTFGITTHQKTPFNLALVLPNHPPFNDFIALIALQYLSLRVALFKELNPDRPRNLAKSVTVE